MPGKKDVISTSGRAALPILQRLGRVPVPAWVSQEWVYPRAVGRCPPRKVQPKASSLPPVGFLPAVVVMDKFTFRRLLDRHDELVDAFDELANLSANNDGGSVFALLNLLALRLRNLHADMEAAISAEAKAES